MTEQTENLEFQRWEDEHVPVLKAELEKEVRPIRILSMEILSLTPTLVVATKYRVGDLPYLFRYLVGSVPEHPRLIITSPDEITVRLPKTHELFEKLTIDRHMLGHVFRESEPDFLPLHNAGAFYIRTPTNELASPYPFGRIGKEIIGIEKVNPKGDDDQFYVTWQYRGSAVLFRGVCDYNAESHYATPLWAIEVDCGHGWGTLNPNEPDIGGFGMADMSEPVEYRLIGKEIGNAGVLYPDHMAINKHEEMRPDSNVTANAIRAHLSGEVPMSFIGGDYPMIDKHNMLGGTMEVVKEEINDAGILTVEWEIAGLDGRFVCEIKTNELSLENISNSRKIAEGILKLDYHTKREVVYNMAQPNTLFRVKDGDMWATDTRYASTSNARFVSEFDHGRMVINRSLLPMESIRGILSKHREN